MRRFFVQVDDTTFRILVDRAVRERRNVRDEAALALERAVAASRTDTTGQEQIRPAVAVPV